MKWDKLFFHPGRIWLSLVLGMIFSIISFFSNRLLRWIVSLQSAHTRGSNDKDTLEFTLDIILPPWLLTLSGTRYNYSCYIYFDNNMPRGLQQKDSSVKFPIYEDVGVDDVYEDMVTSKTYMRTWWHQGYARERDDTPYMSEHGYFADHTRHI